MLEEVEQSRLSPVDVIKQEDDGALLGHELKELPDRPERVLRRAGLVPAEEPADERCDAMLVGRGSVQQGAEFGARG